MTLPDLSGVDPFSRHQPHLQMVDLWPLRTDGLCACGCGAKLTGRRTRWASKQCSRRAAHLYFTVCGNSSTVRFLLWERDGGRCVECRDTKEWQADHITPVHLGGGGCLLDGYQTLCVDCHRAKTTGNAKKRAMRRRGDQQDMFSTLQHEAPATQ